VNSGEANVSTPEKFGKKKGEKRDKRAVENWQVKTFSWGKRTEKKDPSISHQKIGEKTRAHAPTSRGDGGKGNLGDNGVTLTSG